MLKTPARRIISLAPDLTELLFSIGAGTSVIGVMLGSDYPSAALSIPIIGSYQKLDLEKIISLHPDLIVMWGDRFIEQRYKLQQMGITVYRNDPHHLEDTARTIRVLSCLTGNAQRGQQLANEYIEQLYSLKHLYKQRKPITVFFQIGAHPIMTINHNSWINQAIELCGGINIFHDAQLVAPQVSFESILMKNPEVIIMDSHRITWRRDWEHWPQIKAVKQKAVFEIDPQLVERESMRLLQGVRMMCQKIELGRALAQ